MKRLALAASFVLAFGCRQIAGVGTDHVLGRRWRRRSGCTNATAVLSSSSPLALVSVAGGFVSAGVEDSSGTLIANIVACPVGTTCTQPKSILNVGFNDNAQAYAASTQLFYTLDSSSVGSVHSIGYDGMNDATLLANAASPTWIAVSGTRTFWASDDLNGTASVHCIGCGTGDQTWISNLGPTYGLLADANDVYVIADDGTERKRRLRVLHRGGVQRDAADRDHGPPVVPRLPRRRGRERRHQCIRHQRRERDPPHRSDRHADERHQERRGARHRGRSRDGRSLLRDGRRRHRARQSGRHRHARPALVVRPRQPERRLGHRLRREQRVRARRAGDRAVDGLRHQAKLTLTSSRSRRRIGRTRRRTSARLASCGTRATCASNRPCTPRSADECRRWSCPRRSMAEAARRTR